MINLIKTLAFRTLTLERYLRILQQIYFFSYKAGLLRFSRIYDCHYYVRKFIKESDVVIDIGANLGYYSILFSEWVGNTGKVHSVEPIQIYNQVFNKKAKSRNNIILYPYALGTEDRNIQLVSSPHIGYLKTGLPHVYNSEKDGKLETQEFIFDAEMKRPSQLFKDLDRIDYIKCDIEGLEYVVLSEMKELIVKFRPKIQVEVLSGNVNEVLLFFDELSYTAYKVFKNKLIIQQKGTIPVAGDYIFLPE